MLPESQADQITIAKLINSLTLYAFSGNPTRQFKLQAPSGLTSLLNVCVASQKDHVTIMLCTSTLLIDLANFNPITFSGISTHVLPTTATTAITTPATTAAAAGMGIDTSKTTHRKEN